MELFWAIVGLLTLVALEIVLGIDNIIVVAIQVGKLEPTSRRKARLIGLALAGVMRIVLVLFVSVIMRLENTLFTALGHGFTGRDLIMSCGGVWLLWQSVKEINEKVEFLKHHEHLIKAKYADFSRVILSIVLTDIIFSIDSVLTAIGLVESVAVMIAAIVLSVGVMMCFSGYITDFIDRNPGLQILALAFLVLIAVLLIGDGFGQHLSKGFVYFAMAFSLVVDLLQMRAARVKKLHEEMEH